MIEYYIVRERPLPAQAFKISKFDEGSNQPSKIYFVIETRKGLECDCPQGTFRGTCKHLVMVREFVRRGEPQPYVVTTER